MGDILRTVLCAISAAREKRRHDAQHKIEDKMIVDLEALVIANIKRAREQAERDRNEIRRTA